MRQSFTLFSILAHAIVISALLIAQVLAVGELPTPHLPILFEAASIMPADIKLPKPPQRAPAATTEPSASINAAPLTPPTGVSDETGREHELPLSPGTIAGPATGVPDAIEGVGTSVVVAPPPPPVTPPGPMRLHSGMKAPQKIADMPPVYPSLARNAHIQGVVILEAVIDAQGAVSAVRVLRSLPMLDQAAVDAVRQWRFTPALLNNEPVPVVMTVTVNFTLQDR